MISHFVHRAISASSIPHQPNLWQNRSDNFNVRTINMVEIYFLIIVEQIEHGPFLAIVKSMVFIVNSITGCASCAWGTLEILSTLEHPVSCDY